MSFIFFDSDKETTSFIKKNALKTWKMTFIADALRDPKQAQKYENATVISGYVWSVFNAQTLAPFKKLKAIATRSTGLDHIDVAYCKKNKIKILSVPHYGTATVAEFTFTLLLALIRKIADGREMLDELRIQQSTLSGFDLAGKTIGLIGLGDIGKHVAEIAQGFGMKVIAHDPFIKKKITGIKLVKLETLYKQSDIISLHCPATCETKNMLDAKAFQKMKKGALLINTARGQLIDIAALYNAILSKKITGAALDVAAQEHYLFESPSLKEVQNLSKEDLETAFLNQKLLQMEEVVITPHMAFNTREAKTRILQTTVNHLKKIK